MTYIVNTKLSHADSLELTKEAKRTHSSASELIRNAMKNCVEGRLKLDPEEKQYLHKTSMSLDEDTYQAFKKIAADNNLSIDKALGQLIRKGVRNH